MKIFCRTKLFFLGCCGLLAGCGENSSSSGKPSATPVPVATGSMDGVSGKTVFNGVCAVCHLDTGQGVPGVFPPLTGSAIVSAPDPSRLIRVVLHGLQGPIEVSGETYDGVMPGHGSVLSDAEIADALSYLRTRWGGAAGEVSAAEVGRIRSEGKREAMWTWEELSRL